MTTNVVFGKRPSGNVFATQRPSVNVFEDASVTVPTTKGRGIYFWNEADSSYFVNGNTVYKGSYANPLANTLSDGFERVTFYEVGDFLVILDAENNEGWTISIGSNTTLDKITDTDFPPNQTPTLQLAKGGMELNSTMYVYCTNGECFNSSVENPTIWNLLDFVTSEVRSDGGVAMFKHSDHGALLGQRSLEFVYDNANPTGSPLNFRTDVTHDIGTVDEATFFGDANASYFVGMTASGDAGVYLLQNFALNKITNNDLDSFITSALVIDGLKAVGSGFSAGGRGFYVLTLYNVINGVVVPETSLVYDSSTGFWSVWELAQEGGNLFSLVSWTRSTGTRAGGGILANGDVVTIFDDFNPQDSIEAQVYVDADYVDDGYISNTGASGDNIFMQIITGSGSFGTQQDKFMDKVRIKAIPTERPQTMLVQWSDESNDNYNAGRTIDISNPKNKLNRCGSFKTRNFKLSYQGDEQIEFEAVDFNIS